jgi:hypothetical protein
MGGASGEATPGGKTTSLIEKKYIWFFVLNKFYMFEKKIKFNQCRWLFLKFVILSRAAIGTAHPLPPPVSHHLAVILVAAEVYNHVKRIPRYSTVEQYSCVSDSRSSDQEFLACYGSRMIKAVFKGACISVKFELKPCNFKCDFFQQNT